MDTLQDRPGTKRHTQHRRYENGIRHSHDIRTDDAYTARTDGPADILIGDDGRVSEEWAAHPDPSTIKDYNSHEPTSRHGNDIHTYLHREDGPALVERIKRNNIETWFRNNQEYAPTAHERITWEATKVANDGTPFHPETIEAMAGKAPRMGGGSETWKEIRPFFDKKEMEYHRPGGPAYVEYDRKTGTAVREEWFLDGKNKNPNGPYQKRYDPNTGICTQEYGDLTPGRPHHIDRDSKTGKVVWESWQNRENGPRTVLSTATGRIEEHWPNKRSPHLPGKPTVKQAAAWQALKAKQGGPFTPGLDEVPRAQRTGGVKAAAAKAAEPKATKPKTIDRDDAR